MTYTILSAKFGAVNKKSFLTSLAERYGRWLSVIIGICCFLVCAGFQGGNNVGVGMAMNAIFGGPIGLWATLFTVGPDVMYPTPEPHSGGRLHLLFRMGVVVLREF